MRTVAMGLVAVLALAGCTGSTTDKSAPESSPSASPSPATASPKATTPAPSPSPSPTVFESFPPAPANESKDQAAIRAAWMRYWEVYEKFASNPHGYTDFTETQQVTTGEESRIIVKAISRLREKNLRSGGGKKFVNISITGPNLQGNTRTAVITYCIDNTHQVVLQEDGEPLKQELVHLQEKTTLTEVRPGDWRVSMIRNQRTSKC